MVRLLITGQVVMDSLFHMDAIPDRPRKYQAKSGLMVGGGCAANGAVAAARLGGSIMLASRVGADILGTHCIRELEAEGIDCRLVTSVPESSTSHSAIMIDQDGERMIVNNRGGPFSDAPIEHFEDLLSADGLDDFDACLVDTRWSAAADWALRLAQAQKIPGVLDAEPPVPEHLMEKASHIAFSEAGLASVAGIEPETGGAGSDWIPQALSIVQNRYDGRCLVTAGAQGAYVSDEKMITHIPAPSVTVVDTLAAGDVWHGAFAFRLGQKKELENAENALFDAMRFANVAAALKCTRPGGRSGAPNYKTVLNFMNEWI